MFGLHIVSFILYPFLRTISESSLILCIIESAFKKLFNYRVQ
jgi:hypothetical protein